MTKMVSRGRAAWASAIVFLAGISVASAQGGTQPITLVDPLGGKESFSTVATNIANFLFVDIAIPLSIIMVLVGAFQMMTSAGEPDKISQARKTIMYAAIGLGIAIVAGGITTLLKSILTGSS
jgi:hypothetical protein